ncbi:MAG: nuclear transport factor 2 family protein [Trebonia sp.]
MSAADQVLAQLGRQKWAVDARDAEALRGLYTADSEQVIYRDGPEGRQEIARSHGRDQIIAAITAGWARTAGTWHPGAMIHLIGSYVIDPLDDGRMRCRSYAAFLGLDAAGVPGLKGYGAYDDVWAPDEGEWRLAYRETVMYGHAPAALLDSTIGYIIDLTARQ